MTRQEIASLVDAASQVALNKIPASSACNTSPVRAACLTAWGIAYLFAETWLLIATKDED